MLGLYALNQQGMAGGLMTMLNHGVSTGALFLLVGVIYERRHTRQIAQFGGLWKSMPVYASLFLVVTLSSIGLPGTNGFIGEFLVLLGAFQANPVWAIIAASGVILSAVYMLWMYQRVFFGPITHEENGKLNDLTGRERLVFAPLILLIFWIGVFPQPILDRAQPTLDRTVALCKYRMDRASKMAVERSAAGAQTAPVAEEVAPR
jgi:NADH-quinone oxidoreductase subunit M